MKRLPKYAKFIKTPESEQQYLTLAKNLQKLPFDLQREDAEQFQKSKDFVVWINKKAKQNSSNLNYYAFNRRDYTELNILLNKLAYREVDLESKGYNLDGVRSFNRNIWLDLARESNAIEGIMDDFSFDLLDFRTQLKENVISDPKSKFFDEHEYFKELFALYQNLDKDKPITVQGFSKTHELSLATIRHFMAFKYAYKCAKQHKATGKLTSQEFFNILQNVAALLSGTEFVPFRSIPIYINQIVETKFVPVKHDTIPEKIDALCDFVADVNGGGSLHPIEKAAIFHAEYVRIHPYVDGNGRTARILSNFILIQNEIPTIAVRHENTADYMRACNKAILTHEIDDLIDLFYNAALKSAKVTDKCVDYTEQKQKPKIKVSENLEK